MVSTKFEEGSSNQLSLALSAFDDLCIMLAESLSVSEGGPAHLWRELMFQFGTNFHVLVSTLPSVVRLAPSPIAAFSLANNRVESGGDVNFFSLCDIIKRFMRAVATTFRPIMIFWDDMQWCDSVSLGLMHAVLSDNKGGNSGIFFAGSYRDNEVDDEHVLQGFFSWLSVFHVPVNTICLGGLPDVGVLELVSYSLGVLPRLCNALSQVVHRKTEGNPFFVQTFLRSLGTYSCVLSRFIISWTFSYVHALPFQMQLTSTCWYTASARRVGCGI
jgi:predicted ATPase